jgi:hypothetical protein
VADPTITDLVFMEDVALTDALMINRPINLNLSGHEIKGDLQYKFEDEAELILMGSGSIIGDLSVDAPNASVANYISVSGTVDILKVAGESWHEYAQNNRLVVRGPSMRLYAYSGASTIEIAEGVWDVWVKILAGEVAEFIANSGVTVIGADRILRAKVNSPMVVFDLRPQEIDGDFDPTIIQGFEPGSGGTIPEYVPSTAPSNTFAGLYVERNHQWPPEVGITGIPQVDMRFPSAAEFGGAGYTLQYLDPADSTWKPYEGAQMIWAYSYESKVDIWQDTTFRLLMMGGPLDGYTSNEVAVEVSPVETYFSSSGMKGSIPYVGETFTGSAAATRVADRVDVSSEYMSYQWYRVDPVTYEMEAIAGATSKQYTAQAEDAGCALLFKASGDGEHIGGYVQMWAAGDEGKPEIVKFPNKAFISGVTTEGFILNLYMNVPVALSPEDMELMAYGPSALREPLQIKSVSFVPDSQSRLSVTVDIPAAGIESLRLMAEADNWSVVSTSQDGGYLQPNVVYYF